MNKDLVIGILLSFFIHGFVLGFEFIFPKKAVVITTTAAEIPTLQMEPPPPEEEEKDEVEELEDEPVEVVMAPPSLIDVPTLSTIDTFQQQITPPPPPGLATDKSAVSIPILKPGQKFGQGIKDLFNMADLDQIPQLKVPSSPVYPSDLKRQGIEGSCTVEFIVDSNGKVVQAQVVTTTQREFENPSLQAVLKWQFRPGKKGGRAVNTKCQQILQFKLN